MLRRLAGIRKADGHAVQPHLAAFVRLVYAGDDLDEGGLARTVFAHQRVDLALPQFKVYAVQRLDAGECLGDVFQLKQGFRHPTPSLPGLRRGNRKRNAAHPVFTQNWIKLP